MSVAVTHLGCPGHLIVGNRCRWRRHTQIGDTYRVSTLGNYYPYGDGERVTLGAGTDSWFESMVFLTTSGQEHENEGCGCKHVADWGAIDGRRHATAGAAQAGHEALVAKYMAIAETAVTP